MFEKQEKLNKRDVSVTFMLTADERDYLQRMVDESGVRLSDIVRLGLQAMSERFEKGELKDDG